MPRSNRPRGSRREEGEPRDLSQLLAGWRRTETHAGREWNVQPVSAARAVKGYLCPGCGSHISLGQEHVVVWRADGALGDAADLASRRHWHNHCWRIRGAQ
ncbi:hypothetical protein [Rathayibacter toxicus]|uniref:ATP/GTP-binding protein n=1 Tax=Rathayibacter toxicus TaxID=145458 RepID=A0A0C5BEY4_9MICO|nr:hypothetical protein [Rathayibacter toxicus]AJM77574.1 ATP/GTP-binding protein [Rathayibacter toxicus]ALS56500.1 ATP/GTP-binding protein [Rathayibacter toxicus]KKM44602.1 ATP/GTP-binding protein [Rathayibacter toxicus]PPG21677.1 hypothetical protein C5D15_05525 [Rathayibacter toxicus]PPG46639.1 hypothetical protein C5D16_05500 [Rathayibacter toxicus]